jgi:hypothetical protein
LIIHTRRTARPQSFAQGVGGKCSYGLEGPGDGEVAELEAEADTVHLPSLSRHRVGVADAASLADPQVRALWAADAPGLGDRAQNSPQEARRAAGLERVRLDHGRFVDRHHLVRRWHRAGRSHRSRDSAPVARPGPALNARRFDQVEVTMGAGQRPDAQLVRVRAVVHGIALVAGHGSLSAVNFIGASPDAVVGRSGPATGQTGGGLFCPCAKGQAEKAPPVSDVGRRRGKPRAFFWRAPGPAA